MLTTAIDPGQIGLEIPARVEFVSFVRVVVAAAAELEPDLDSERVEDLKVAVSEAATNAIEAHGLSGSSDRIGIRIDLDDAEMSVEVHDHGVGFDPDKLPAMPAPDSPERLSHEAGLGVQLMSRLVDEVDISSSAEGTVVRLVLRIAEPLVP